MSTDKPKPSRKTCSKCGESKPTDKWPARKDSRDGLHGWCRECHRAYFVAKSRRWRAENPGRANELQRARYAADPERFKAAQQAWRDENREVVNERARAAYRDNGGLEESRRRRKENPEPGRAACRRWYRRNRQKVLDAMHRRRMEEEAGYVTPGFIDWLTEQPCMYCGAEGPSEVDHVAPIARGGEHDEMNLAPACRKCNASKGKKTLFEWKGADYG